MKIRSAGVSLALATCLFVSQAFADPSAEETERARTFFNAGAQAYGAAKYADAVRSFEQAFAIAPRPQILFSLAQAERKEFQDHGDPAVLRQSIAHYKAYLEKVPSGGRRSEALEAKTELEAKLSHADAQRPAEGPSASARKPRVTVFSPTPGAQASFDGGPPEELPYFADLSPGKHKVRVFGDGYFDAEQEISGDKGLDVPVNLPLREKPALVTVVLSVSADIYVDGRLVANAPLNRPIEVPPGPHIVAVSRNGMKAWSQDVVLERGKPFTVEPKLATSGQRVLAIAMLGTGLATVAVGGLAALIASGQQERVQDLDAKREKENLTASELEEHNNLISQRDDARTAAIVLASVGGAITVGGVLFYFLDKPVVPLLPPRSVEPATKPQMPLDVTASVRPYPLLGPGVVGAGFTAKF